ncbi:MAG: carbon monoxide dehydrogenase subunit [Acidimicrobiia bacterium]|nr:carbon monoxide dehydrogenase subunit [Acidimicrobiia bacterium]
MELVNDFTVSAPIEEAWKILTDLERIAPCLPGAQLTEVEGDVYRGLVKIKVGPITAKFQGQAQFTELDAENHKGTIKADGKDTTGKGNASAFIHAVLTPISETSTKCAITTDLTFTGKVAQFGRGALVDVSTKLIGQFVNNLETMVLAGDTASDEPGTAPAAATAADPAPEGEPAVAAEAPPTTGATEAPTAAPTIRKIDSAEPEAVNLLEAAGGTVAKRLLPVGVVALLVWFLWRRRRQG